eukprot:scaffold563_cov29-Tisochrysis_lutea.AAC.4
MLRILLPPAHPHSFFQIKLETRIPAAFLSGLTALVPNVSGLNLELQASYIPVSFMLFLLSWPCSTCNCAVHDRAGIAGPHTWEQGGIGIS